MSDWDVEIGETLPRRELHARHGGAWYGGMEPAVASNSVFLFTNPSQGEAFGYKYDGWQPDGTFHYTGDGQVGTQNPAQGGNAALLAAASKGRTVRLFRSEGTLTTYLGAFELLDDPPYFTAPAPDREGNLRDVLVFRLSPVGDALRDQTDVAPPPPYDVLVLPLEALDVDNYERQRPQEPREAVRREAALVRRYAEWLSVNGRDSCRQQIRLPDGTSLYTDLFDVATDELIEAKADAERGSVRAGLGQVLDYGRVDHSTKALLLPSRPAEDLLELLHDYGVAVIWSVGDGFDRS